jgi:hypothetical protein
VNGEAYAKRFGVGVTVLAAHGHDTITDKTQVAHIDDKPDPNSIN